MCAAIRSQLRYLFFRPFAIILPKARFSHFEDVSGVMIPQDKVRKLVSSGMVAHEFLHTGQNLITDGIKINLCLDQHTLSLKDICWLLFTLNDINLTTLQIYNHYNTIDLGVVRLAAYSIFRNFLYF